ncbi:MAG: ATP-binding protein [Desulfopila sp.]|jgi:PAS domain S-box-containing protein|nr:ATP-binding protein [Desulfopila sp.]
MRAAAAGKTDNLMFRKSIRFKITLGIMLILGAILLLLGNVSIKEQRNRMMAQMNSYGKETSSFIAQISIVPIQKYSIYQLENFVAQLESGELVAYCEIYDKEGNALAHSSKSPRDTEQSYRSENILIFNADITDESGYLGQVELGLDLEPFLARINRTSLYIFIAFVLELLILGFAVSYFIHKSLVSPILKLSHTTKSIAAGRFTTSDQADRDDELGLLAKTINTMSRNLEESYTSLEQRVQSRTAELTAAKNASEETTRNLKVVSSELQALLDNSPAAILFVTPDRTIKRVNLEFASIFGFSPSEVAGKSTRILYRSDEDFHNATKTTYAVLRHKGFCQTTLQMQKKDGTPIVCSLRGRITFADSDTEGVIWSIEDITAKTRMEAELLKVKKLESIGVLAGGIAHDFNNILVAIIGNISLAEQFINNNPKVSELLLNSKKASLRAKDLTTKLLTFAKGGEPVKAIEPLPEILKESASFVLSGSNVKCVYDFEEGLWAVPMDKAQINQVIQNLILNADQSMPIGGTIHITCCNTILFHNEIADLDAGEYVRIEISDTGSGIKNEIINLIFDPYFSTKEKSGDKGSGLGLSIVHSIVSKHGGAIDVNSSPGKGTTFTLFLPAAGDSEERKKEQGEAIPMGYGRILLMDDEETIHSIGEAMLTYLGYETLHAFNGEEAIAIYKKHLEKEDRIDAVIMDLTIPGGMGGAVAVRKILEINPSAKVLVSSGYSDDPAVQNYREAGFCNIITKPYQLADISRILAETIKG